MQGHYRVKSPDLKPLHERAVKLSHGFEHFEIAHVPREKNREADRLVNEALDGAPGGRVREESQAAGTARTIRARYSGGILVPSEPLDLADGAEITLTIKPAGSRKE
jgi:probable phosphoglycerate mutase